MFPNFDRKPIILPGLNGEKICVVRDNVAYLVGLKTTNGMEVTEIAFTNPPGRFTITKSIEEVTSLIWPGV